MRRIVIIIGVIILGIASILLFTSSNAFGINEPRMISAGYGLERIAVNPDTNMVYVANANNSITVIDGATNKIATLLDLGRREVYDYPVGYSVRMAVNNNTNKVYAVSDFANLVYVIDGLKNKVIERISLDEHRYGVSIDVNTNTNMVYVVRFPNFLYIIDGSTNKVVDKLYIGEHMNDAGSIRPPELAVNPNTNMVYATDYFAKSVAVIDGSKNKIVANITTSSYPIGVAVNPVTNRIYVMTGGSISVIDGFTNEAGTLAPCICPSISPSSISVIDGFTNEEITNIPYNSISREDAITVNPRTNLIYITGYVNDPDGSDSIIAIDTLTNEMVTTRSLDIPGPIDISAWGIAVNPNTNKLYVSSGGMVMVIDEEWVTADPWREERFVIRSYPDNSLYITGKANNTRPIGFVINPEKSAIEIRLLDGRQGEIMTVLPTNVIGEIQSVRTYPRGDVPFEVLTSNPDSTTIKFTVPNNKGWVEIAGTYVIPEFPAVFAVFSASLVTFIVLNRFASRRKIKLW